MNISGDAAADQLLDEDPFALVVGMLLDQQVPMEHAFSGPALIRDRLGAFDAATIAGTDPEDFVALCARPPAVHRYPASMGARVHALAVRVRDQMDGDVTTVWTGAADGRDLVKRLQALPGFGQQKAQIFTALLGKQRGVRVEGWREAAGQYGEDGSFRSVADVVDADSLAKVRAHKQEQKRKARA